MSDGVTSTSGPDLQADNKAAEHDACEEANPEAENAVCQNCGTPLAGGYCHSCGQRHLPQLRLRDLGRRFLETVLDIDDLGAGLRRTFLGGIRSPGGLARQYVDGKRKRIVNPIGYFLIATTLVFVVYGFFRAEWVQGQAELMRAQWEAMGLNPDEMFSEGTPFRERYGWTSATDLAGALFSVFQQIQSYFGVLVCLLAAGVLRGLFSRPNYADLVVFELYTVAQANLLLAFLVPALQAWSSTTIFTTGPLLMIVLHVLAGPGFFGRSWKGWMLPPLAAATALMGQLALSAIAGFVWGFLFF